MLDSIDGDLVIRGQRGDIDAIGELYDRHHQRIFKYVYTRVRNKGLAEDVTGEVFTRMVVNLPAYRPTGIPFIAWLYRIAHNLMVDHYRKDKDYMSIPLYHAETVGSSKGNPTSVVEKNLTLEKVQRALEQIDPLQQEVIVLRFLTGLSLNEVALTLDKSVSAVKSLQHRGLAALRVALKQE